GYLLTDWERLPTLAHDAVDALFIVNLGWGLLNLLPIWPLDGGQISRDFLDWLMPSRGIRASLGISFTLAGLIAINSLMAGFGRTVLPFLPFGGTYMAIMFALLALGSYQQLQMESTIERRPWEREHDSWR